VNPPEKRAANFGLIGVAFGLGFIAGPALGGFLGQSDLRLSCVACAVLTFGNFLFGLLVMPKSLRANRRAINWSETNPVGGRAGRAISSWGALLCVAALVLAARQPAMQAEHSHQRLTPESARRLSRPWSATHSTVAASQQRALRGVHGAIGHLVDD
jgi:MFS family permease